MVITENPILSLNSFLQPKRNDLKKIYDRVGVRYYSYARVALYFGLRDIGLPAGSSVLIPRYICNSAIAPFHSLGLNIVYYDIGPRFKVDLDLLRKVAPPDARALMIVDYFGFPQPFSDIRSFCQERSMVLLEDNTHGFLSSFEGQMLGTFGDLGIISVRKSVPIPNGALLLTRFDLCSHENRQTLSGASASGLANFFLRNILRSLDSRLGKSFMTARRFRKIDCVRELSAEEFSLDRYMVNPSRIGRFLLERMDLEQYKETRVDNYETMLRILSSIPSLRPVLYPVPSGVIPFSFPLCVEDLDRFHNFCRKKAIEYSTWPNYPQGVSPVTEYQNLVFLPIHSKFDFAVLLEYA